eukprot:scaffold1312_cov393-Prasinococcus_capsulatus_cf.AAC.5
MHRPRSRKVRRPIANWPHKLAEECAQGGGHEQRESPTTPSATAFSPPSLTRRCGDGAGHQCVPSLGERVTRGRPSPAWISAGRWRCALPPGGTRPSPLLCGRGPPATDCRLGDPLAHQRHHDDAAAAAAADAPNAWAVCYAAA